MDRKIGIVSANDNRIYLINNDGTIYNGFPKTGRTLFSIGYLVKAQNKFFLVTGSDENFVYSYELTE